MNARDALFWALWDNYRQAEKNQFIDAYRDEVALEIGRDVLRDGLVPTLTRLVGEANAMRLMIESRSGGADDEGSAETSARADLANGLAEHACCFSEDDAKVMVAAFAHELAEQIRQESSDQWERGNQDWDTDDAANFIDPLKDPT